MASQPRRLLLALLATPVVFLFLLYLGSPASRRPLSVLFSGKQPDEIFGLLHFVTSPDEAGRTITLVGDLTHDNPDSEVDDGPVAPHEPVPMAWYAFGSGTRGGDWNARLEALHTHAPLVVFSKTYCPYSKRAKRILETYGLSPAPRVVEVDLRTDASHIKTLLTRLTHRSTFPNIILHGRSLGGSDELVRLHEEGKLRRLFEQAGVKVTGEGDGVIPV